ncbi:phasin family protein [Salinimonas sediminis]|uniref:Phasin family protein n=1 Tax=Salinimonas sediminis TaxID=2303538 RepID=A0A346NI01_9ALTE|nr:phasin family protein [Salinimonas sediminis]AXR05158.1 phasin family protein [Salinimonas sediminis]
MFEQLNEQMKNAMKPMTDLAALNMNTMQSLAEKQSELYSSLLTDGMSYMEQLSQQKDMMAMAETQKAYMESVQEKMTETAKTSYSIVSEAQQKAGEMVKGMSEDMGTKFTSATQV